MQRIILDTNIILQNPKILGFKSSKYHLYIPYSVFDELASRSVKDSFHYDNIIRQANKANNIIILEPEPLSITQAPPKESPFFRMSVTDRKILATAIKMTGEYKQDQVVIATNDRDIIEVAKFYNIATLDSRSLFQTLVSNGASDKIIDKEAQVTLSAQRNQLIISFILGSVVTFLAILFYLNLDYVFANIHVWITFILVPVLAMFLFWLRANHRQLYSWIEILFGFSASINVFWPSFNIGMLHATILLQLMAGLYVMVRGLDNLGKSLKGGRYYQTWNRIFPE